MSLINKVLQDLDKRSSTAPAAGAASPHVRAVRAAGSGHEWFWRVLGVLVLLSVSWVGWVAWQLQPRPLATELALTAGEAAQKKPAKPAAAPVVTAPAPAPAEKPAAAPAPQAAASAPPAPPPELFKLALSIDRPIAERRAPVARKAPPAAVVPPPVRVSKHERGPAEDAEAQFHRGVALLNQGRISEAEQNFTAALLRYPAHEAARQALIALRIERREFGEAQMLLEQGLALYPEQAQFAMVLARIHVERQDYAAAARVLTLSGEAARNNPDYQLVRGAVMQRLGRHDEAVEALQAATRLPNAPATGLVALGISLEASGRKTEALEAYKRSLEMTLAPETRSYALGRVRMLQ